MRSLKDNLSKDSFMLSSFLCGALDVFKNKSFTVICMTDLKVGDLTENFTVGSSMLEVDADSKKLEVEVK